MGSVCLLLALLIYSLVSSDSIIVVVVGLVGLVVQIGIRYYLFLSSSAC